MRASTNRGRGRRVLAVLVAAATAIGLAACGGDDGGSASTSAADSTTAATEAPADAAFPVTIEHAFGATTVEDEPQRVVTIGYTDADPVLALGVTPVGIRQWYGDFEYVWPWAQDALGDATPALLVGEDLNFEQIATLDPDLILGLYVGLEQDDYDKLSAIAPTIAQSGDYSPYGTPWQEMTRTAGRALGRSAQAEALIAGVEDRFAAARADHPEFEGVGLAYAGVYGEQQFYVETEGSTRVQVMLDLGFVVPDDLAALGSDTFYHQISAEQLELLDQDVIVWEPADPALMPAVLANPLYTSLAVHIEAREVLLTDPIVAGALAHSTVLSLPVALDFLVPALATAVSNLPD